MPKSRAASHTAGVCFIGDHLIVAGAFAVESIDFATICGTRGADFVGLRRTIQSSPSHWPPYSCISANKYTDENQHDGMKNRASFADFDGAPHMATNAVILLP